MAKMASDDRRITQLLASAAEAQRRGDSGRASADLESVLRLQPDHPAALNSLGMQALARNDSKLAETYFARAAEADPSAPALWVNLATARRRCGNDEGERAALSRILEIDQRHLMANIRLAELHERLGETAPALHRWAAVIALVNALPELPPGFADIVSHAETFVALQSHEFGDIVDRGLSEARSGLDRRERRRFDACVDALLGRRRIYHNECSGIHVPFLPADEFFERDHFPWLAELESHTDVIRGELENLLTEGLEQFSPYVKMEPGTPTNKWSALDHSPDWSAYFLWHFGRKDEDACARCPRTAELLESIPLVQMANRAPTVLFSILRPRSRLPAHTGVSNTRAIVHLPLIIPPGCGFRVGGETREWRVGEGFAFDDTIEHEAWNDSDQLRAIMILDVWNPHLTEAERRLIQTFVTVADGSGFNARTGVAE